MRWLLLLLLAADSQAFSPLTPQFTSLSGARAHFSLKARRAVSAAQPLSRSATGLLSLRCSQDSFADVLGKEASDTDANTLLRVEFENYDLDELRKYVQFYPYSAILPVQPMMMEPIQEGVNVIFRKKPTKERGSMDGGLRVTITESSVLWDPHRWPGASRTKEEGLETATPEDSETLKGRKGGVEKYNFTFSTPHPQHLTIMPLTILNMSHYLLASASSCSTTPSLTSSLSQRLPLSMSKLARPLTRSTDRPSAPLVRYDRRRASLVVTRVTEGQNVSKMMSEKLIIQKMLKDLKTLQAPKGQVVTYGCGLVLPNLD